MFHVFRLNCNIQIGGRVGVDQTFTHSLRAFTSMADAFHGHQTQIGIVLYQMFDLIFLDIILNRVPSVDQSS